MEEKAVHEQDVLNEQYLTPEPVVSWSGTRHLRGPVFSRMHTGRITTWCGFGIRPDEQGDKAIRECEFCKAALRQAQLQKGAQS